MRDWFSRGTRAFSRLTTRRRFLQHSAVGSALLWQATSAEATQAQEANSALPIVDTHQHLWDLQKFRLPWLSGVPEVLRRSYGMADFRAATAGLNVTRAIYMEVDVAPDQQVAEAEELLAICRAGDSPTVGAVISGRPNSTGFREYILKYRDTPEIHGVRQVLHPPETPAGHCLAATFVQSVRLLGELGKSFDLCMRPEELGDAVRLVEQCPGTRFILDHCGNADLLAFLSPAVRGDKKPSHTVDQWKRDIASLARHDRVVCKISGIIAQVPPGKQHAEMLAAPINFCLDTFGPDRVIFGGDWPVCLLGASYRQWVETLKSIIASRPLEQQRKLLAENAVRWYSLRR